MVAFTGLNSVLDRTLFTNRGPIVKRPLDLLTGSNLRIESPREVSIETGSFTQSDIGKVLAISGSPGGRNDGTFPIEAVLSSKRLRLAGASFSILNEAATIQSVVALANDVKRQYNFHRTRKVSVDGEDEGVHGTDDAVNVVLSPDALDLTSAIALLNELRTKLSAHVVNVSLDPPVHEEPDPDDQVEAPAASALGSAILLANDVRRRYESHRQNRFVHQHVDVVDRVTVPAASPVTGTFPGSLTGPFSWVLQDLRTGIVADHPYDVDVKVNGSPAAVEAVFGGLGAVVLSQKPSGSDSVTVSYDHLNNPPARFLRIGSPEFCLNQAGNRGHGGFPKHRYRSRSYLISPGNSPDFMSARQPLRRGWKYKALERAYTAVLNDPTTLLLNVPTNKVSYPVLFERVSEFTLRYDPATLPQNAIDPWTLEGDGTFSLAPGGNVLTIVDSSVQTGTDSSPPFFTHALDVRTESLISGAFRVRASDEESVFQPDGVFSGIAFGISDGQKAAVAGLILTESTNLSSALVMANEVKAEFDAHLSNLGSHSPDDVQEAVSVVDASDLTSLIILVNNIRAKYSAHAAKGGGPGLVHAAADSANAVLLPDASDLQSAVALTNELRQRLNAHGAQPGVHFVDDLNHQVGLVMQVGLLTNLGFPEFAESWQSVASDWRDFRTYRVFIGSDGSADFFLSGDTSPSASVPSSDLPALSDLDGRFDPIRQAFFGSIGKESKSSSDWQFIRVNVQPLDANLIEGNKQVEYDGSVLPELSPSAPWITYGQGGFERILSPDVLLLDSTSSAAPADVPGLGLTSGAYRGFVRFEPVLSPATSAVLEFRASADFYTHGLSNRAFAAVLDDGEFSLQFAFLQFSPSPATVTGTVAEPFVLVTGDQLILRIGDGPQVTVPFSVPPDVNTAAGVAAKINSVLGFPFASSSAGKVKLTSQDLGAAASFTIVSGSALAKLGFSPGPYFGRDSNPDPKVSWFGANLPDLDDPAWVRGGGQSATLLGRTLRITDADSGDYAAYTLSDPLVTSQAFGPLLDWKLDFRVRVLSHDGGVSVPGSGPYMTLSSVGPIIAVDEGPSGRQVEVHLALSPSGDAFLNLLSFNPSTGALDVMAQYAFDWDDAQIHTFNVFTSKSINAILVLADGQVLSPFAGPAPTYSGLNAGDFGPQVSFGSGGEPVVGADLRVPKSVVDWHSVAVFRDSKVGDPTAASRRYVGVYRGGPADLLSSYYLHQIDWGSLHVYRIVRDPVVGVSVYVDGGAVPVIAASYDVLTLPPSSASYLKDATGSSSVVAFGAFSPAEISRTRWDFVRYSIGKITLTDRLVPPHQVLNQGNVMASPEHLLTKEPHSHAGFRVYSGGTPLDDFMSDDGVPAFTVLGEGTPPVPMTQNLESRGGMRKVATPLDGVPALDVVNVNGYLSDLIDDTFNAAQDTAETVAGATAQAVSLANDLKARFNLHRTQAGVHSSNDAVNAVTSPDATDLASSITLLNEIKARFNAHLVQAGVHSPDDTVDAVTVPDAVDVTTAVSLANDIRRRYSDHLLNGPFHLAPDTVDAVTDPDASDFESSVRLAASLVRNFSAHALSSAFHADPDEAGGSFATGIPGVGTATVSTLNTVTTGDGLDVGALVKFLDGPNAGQSRFVISVASSTQYLVSPFFPSDDASGSRFVRMGSGTVLASGVAASVTNVVLDPPAVPFQVGDAVMFLSGPNSTSPRTVASIVSSSEFTVTPALPFADATPRVLSLVRSPATPGVEPTAVIAAANGVRTRYNAHLTRLGAHVTDDVMNPVSVPAAAVIGDVPALLNAEKAAFNLHRTGSRFHPGRDDFNAVSSPAATDPLQSSLDTLNSVREEYLLHVVEPRVHLADDVVNVVLPGPASSLSEAVDLGNSLKRELNRHLTATIRETQKVHVEDDSVNTVTAPDATDLASLAVLAQDVADSYNAHRTQAGVHGSSLFIRLDPPDRVLYEGIKFWNFDEGDAGTVVSPFSDDETLHVDGPVSYSATRRMSYFGSVLPEDDDELKVRILANDLKAMFNLHRTQAGVHVSNDSVNVVTAPDATDLASAITLLVQLKEKFGTHLSQSGVHLATDSDDLPLVNDPTDVKTAISLATELRLKYGTHRESPAFHPVPDLVNLVAAEDPPPVADPGWVLSVQGPGTVGVSLVTAGPDDAVRMQAAAPGVTAAYRKGTGLPDSSSLRFELEVRMRVSSYSYSPDVDTGMYAGFLSNAGPGVAAAVGFDALNNIPYLKIQDVNADVPLFRVPFNWADGLFHTYKLVRDERTNSISLVIVS